MLLVSKHTDNRNMSRALRLTEAYQVAVKKKGYKGT